MNQTHQSQASPTTVRGGMAELRETAKIVFWGLVLLAMIVLLRDVRVGLPGDFPSRNLTPAELAPAVPGEAPVAPQP